MRAVIIRQGDHLAGLAARLGFDADEVWQHERNAELRERRDNPQVLSPGDILYVPDPPANALTLQPNTENRYRAPQPALRIALVVDDGSGRLANAAYRLEGLSSPREGTTDGDGSLEEWVPPRTREVRLVFPEHEDLTMTLPLGHLDPIEQTSGTWDRLEALGYLASITLADPSALEEVLDVDERNRRLAAALRTFQSDRDLEQTGTLDDETRAALEEAHGA